MSIEINGAGVITGVDSLSTPAVTNTAGSASAPSITFTGDTNTGIYSPGADQVAISTGGTGRLFVDASGRVGIGATPSYALDVTGLINTRNANSSAFDAIQFYGTGMGTNNKFWRTQITTTDQNWQTVDDAYTTANTWLKATRNGNQVETISFHTGTSGTSERLRITSAGLVGVGTSSPDAGSLLDVRGNIYSGNGTVKNIIGNVGGDGIVGTSSNHPLKVYTNGSVALTVDTSQRVGIGTTSPQADLHIGNADGASRSIVIHTINNGDARLRFREGSTVSSGYNEYSFGMAGNANAMTWESQGLGEIGRWDSSGRLLVGTSSARANFFNASDASAVLQIEGSGTGRRASILGTSDGYPYLILGRQRGSVGQNVVVNSGDGVGAISFQGSDGTEFVEAATITAEVDGTPGANDMPGRLVFSVTRDGQASPTEAMRIVSSGAFKFSTSGSYLNAANTANEFTQSNDNDGLVVRATSGTYINDVVQIRASRNTTNGTFYALSYYNDGAGAYRLRIADSGNVLNTNNSYGALSDFKLKENIVDATSQWSDIKALQVRKYNFKEETGQQTHTQIGLVAQEVELVSPGLVTESPDRDAEGNDLGTVTKSVNYSVLYMKAVKALQEAMERIEQLEAKVSVLEAKP